VFPDRLLESRKFRNWFLFLFTTFCEVYLRFISAIARSATRVLAVVETSVCSSHSAAL